MIHWFSQRITIKGVIVFASILLVAIVLRFYLLGQNPASLDWDEASMGYNAYSLLHTGADEYGNRLPLEIRSFDDYKPPVYTYLTIPAVAIFGLNSFAVRLPAAVFGVIAVIAVFFLTQELLENIPQKFLTIKRFAPFLAMFFLAVSPWHLQFSRAAFEGNIGVCFFIIALTFFLKGLKNGWWYVASSPFFILSMYSYHSFRLVVPIFFIIAIILFWRNLWTSKWLVVLSFVLLLLITFPIYQSFIMPTSGSHARLSMVTIFGNSEFLQPSISQLEKSKATHNTLGIILNNRRVVYTTAIISGYIAHFDPNFLFLNGDGGRQHHAVHMGMMYLWDLPFLLLGLLFVLRNTNKKLLLVLLFILIGPIPASITTGTPHPVRAISMIPFLQIIIAIGFIWFVILLKNYATRFIISAIIAISVFLFAFNFIYYLQQYYIETPKAFAVFWQYGYKEVFAKTHKLESKYDKVIVTYYYDQPYIYYLFFNKTDPTWYQQHWDINMNGKVDRMYRVIGKYEFRKIDWPKDSQRKKTLIVAGPKEVPENVKPLETIYFPDGNMAFEIIAL